MDIVRLGIVGMGNIGRHHADYLLRDEVKRCRLAAVASGNPATELATFTRSLLTSLLTTALDFGTLVGLTELAGVNYVLATWLGTVVGSLSNFAINKVWAFRAGGLAAIPAILRFVVVQADDGYAL